MCLSDYKIASQAKINVFRIFFTLHAPSLAGTPFKKCQKKPLILDFEAVYYLPFIFSDGLQLVVMIIPGVVENPPFVHRLCWKKESFIMEALAID